MSFRIAANTTANRSSYFSSSSSSRLARSPCDSSTRRSFTNARMMRMFTRIARVLCKTLEQHRDTLLGEGIRRISPAAASDL